MRRFPETLLRGASRSFSAAFEKVALQLFGGKWRLSRALSGSARLEHAARLP